MSHFAGYGSSVTLPQYENRVYIEWYVPVFGSGLSPGIADT